VASLTLEREALQRQFQKLAGGADTQALREENESLKGRLIDQRTDELKERSSGVQAEPAAAQVRRGNLGPEQKVPDAPLNEAASRRANALPTKPQPLEKQLADARKALQTSADLVSVLQIALQRAEEEKDALASGINRPKPVTGNAPDARPTPQRSEIVPSPQQAAVSRARSDASEGRALSSTPEARPIKTPEAIGARSLSNYQNRPSRHPDADNRLLVSEAESALAARNYDEAEEKYTRAMRLDENNVRIRAQLAAAQLGQNRLAESEANLKRALTADPKNSLGLSLLGIVKVRQHKYDEALTLLSQSAQLDPQNAETFQYLGVALWEKGMRMPAESAFRRVLQLAPENAEAHYHLALVYSTYRPPALELARWHYQKGLASGHPKDVKLEQLLGVNKPSTAGGVNALNR
jgi:tetratricopeptide (TPR) repeat protein